MRTSLNTKITIQGILSFFYVYPDGRWEFIKKITNDVMYSGADVLAKALVAQPGIFVRGMYMEYTTTPPASPPAVSQDRTPAYYEALSSPLGYCRVPITAAPGFTASDVEYNGNIVTVQAQTDGTYEAGAAFADGSEVYSAALVVMPDPDDKSQDILFSAANTDAPIPKIANAQVGIKWDIKFL